MSKNIQIKHHDGTNWVELFPKTVASIVELNSGQNVQAVVTSLINDLADKVTIDQVDAEIEKIVGAAPDALNTLQEIADALGNDENFAASVTAQISNKVDKVSGKQLTTNDFTNTLKNKLDGLKDHSSEINNLQSDKADKSTTYTKSEVDTRINNLQANAIPVSTTEPTGASVWFEEL